MNWEGCARKSLGRILCTIQHLPEGTEETHEKLESSTENYTRYC
jgi:hypothetical protein